MFADPVGIEERRAAGGGALCDEVALDKAFLLFSNNVSREWRRYITH